MCGKVAEYFSKKNKDPLCEACFNIDTFLFSAREKSRRLSGR